VYKTDNSVFERKSPAQHRLDVLVLSETSFTGLLVSVQQNIDGQQVLVEYLQRCIKMVDEREDKPAVKEHKAAQNQLTAAVKKAKDLTNFLHELSTHWAPEENRVIGRHWP
jgi:hypothetical protein